MMELILKCSLCSPHDPRIIGTVKSGKKARKALRHHAKFHILTAKYKPSHITGLVFYEHEGAIFVPDYFDLDDKLGEK